MDEFVELRRNFFSVPKDAINLADYEDMPRKAPSSTIHWDELEIGYRTIILAEAGSGKTVEIQQAAKRIRAAGKRSFFLRLEYLLEEFEDAFDGGEKGSYDEFKQWLTSNDEAWLFLESVVSGEIALDPSIDDLFSVDQTSTINPGSNPVPSPGYPLAFETILVEPTM
ncbi:hypothetical protein [Rhizobium leguminosarum]|uniref:hypothetical protein n=1 Tax=Rhizobium leguminosarum TaxID=384 RepID=UPI0012BC8E3D|nr:hypothetical protein [Rhizobium leguminosarum]